MLEWVIEKLISDGHITQEKFDEIVAEQERELAENPPPFVAVVKEKTNELDTRTLDMQFIDFFTLDQTDRINARTEDMQNIDQYSLDLIFSLQQEIETLKTKIETLEGGA